MGISSTLRPSGAATTAAPLESSEILKLLDQVIAKYSPGGDFGKAETALLGRAKTKAMAKGEQSLVSAGLAGTTAGVGMGQKWEEEIGMPSKLKLEDTRTQRLMEAFMAKAGYMERTALSQSQLDRRAFTGHGGGDDSSSPYISDAGGGDSYGGTGAAGSAVGDTGGYGSDYGGAGGSYSGAGGGRGFAPGELTVREGGLEWPAGLSGDLREKIAAIQAGRASIAGLSKQGAIDRLVQRYKNKAGGGASPGAIGEKWLGQGIDVGGGGSVLGGM